MPEIPEFPSHLAVLDLETTGVDTSQDVPVQSFFGVLPWSCERFVVAQEVVWIAPPEEVERTTKIHRISPALSQQGLHLEFALYQIADSLDLFREAFPKCPLVLQNAPFDLSMLLSCADRVNRNLANRIRRTLSKIRVMDTLVLDKRLDKWRKGSRNLSALAQAYLGKSQPRLNSSQFNRESSRENLSTLLSTTHDARVDCELTGRVFVEICEKYRLKVDKKLSRDQAAWHEEQRLSYAEFRRKKDKFFSNADQKGWPVYDNANK